jgi:hypothetical protein
MMGTSKAQRPLAAANNRLNVFYSQGTGRLVNRWVFSPMADVEQELE